MNPHESIVPILAIDDSNNIKYFLGTGTFIDKRPLLLTAYHVIKDWDGLFAMAFISDPGYVYRLQLIRCDKDADLAIFEAPGCPVTNVITLTPHDKINFNHQVVSLEYGTTRTVGREIQLGPATRLGNVTRVLNLTDQYGKAGDFMLELSFPALRGASGSPVLSNPGFLLLGVVVANVEYHLLPAQIESVLDEGNNLLEEKRYLLPQALAVHVKHVRELLEGI